MKKTIKLKFEKIPPESEWMEFENIMVLKRPLKDSDGKIINNLNFYEQKELLKEVSREWKVNARHLTLEENFKLSRFGNEYRKNVLVPFWVLTGELVKRGGDVSGFKKNCDFWYGEFFDENDLSAVRCDCDSDEQGLGADADWPLFRYDDGAVGICYEIKSKDRIELLNSPRKEIVKFLRENGWNTDAEYYEGSTEDIKAVPIKNIPDLIHLVRQVERDEILKKIDESPYANWGTRKALIEWLKEILK
jgi:hypothetical protein